MPATNPDQMDDIHLFLHLYVRGQVPLECGHGNVKNFIKANGATPV